MSGWRVVLTADETMMSTYGGRLFLGFLTTGPIKGFIPMPLMEKFILTPIPSKSNGEAILAPHGLRRVEAALIESGVVDENDVIVVHPRNLRKVVGSNTKAILISAIDPLGMGPASTTFAGPYGVIHAESFTKRKFRELVCSNIVQRVRKHGTVIVGGPGAWQISRDVMYDYGIDIVVVGEGEKKVPELLGKILKGWKPKEPMIVYVNRNEIVSADEIPLLRGGTIGGLVEISRGCGRGCKFCSPTTVPLRHRRIDDILKDVEVNVRAGQTSICLHAEDVLQYGGTPFRKRPEKVVELFSRVTSSPGVVNVGISHASLASIAEMPNTVARVSEIIALSDRKWMGYQTGIESGSPRLIEMWMKFKPYPFKPKDWPDVVEQAFGISNDYHWVPAATLIVNLPGETEDDILKTVELIDRLRPYKSLIVPLLFVPLRPTEGCRRMRLLEDASPAHWELYKAIWEHDMHWLRKLASEYLNNISVMRRTAILVKFVVNVITWYANKRVKRIINEGKQRSLSKAIILR